MCTTQKFLTRDLVFEIAGFHDGKKLIMSPCITHLNVYITRNKLKIAKFQTHLQIQPFDFIDYTLYFVVAFLVPSCIV